MSYDSHFLVVCFQMTDAKHLKEEGNKFFNEGNFGEALAFYTKALSDSSINDAEKATLLRNRAACFLKLNKDVEAIADCTGGKLNFSALVRIEEFFILCQKI
jgi:hypothetical protein